ncbi:hypothetical protein EKG40_14370 [Pseudomonas moorei]|nr:hypothetical protein EKG40_14370 [Pseudomonas moorei]
MPLTIANRVDRRPAGQPGTLCELAPGGVPTMIVNDGACLQVKRGALGSIASRLAPRLVLVEPGIGLRICYAVYASANATTASHRGHNLDTLGNRTDGHEKVANRDVQRQRHARPAAEPAGLART